VKPRAGLFVTCLVDLLRPSVGFAAVRLIEAAGCRVEVVEGQTCCGQPAYNSGDRQSTREIALATVRAFQGCDYVVAPSGSCAAMLKLHYPRLFTGAEEHAEEVRAFAERVHELTSFLVNVRGMTSVPGRLKARAAYHDACSGLRELGIAGEPRRLLGTVEGLELVELADSESCCGFGGLFSVKYPEISNAMVEKKAAAIARAAPDIVLGGDLGCLANIAGKLRREGSAIACRHVAEVLAGELSDPPLAYPDSP
jgi:L-lactate dehydrogenase complex protein LldE